MHPEGYIKGTEWHYYLKDHLGNTRVDFVANGTSTSNVQDYHYYPFGMDFTGLNVGNSDNKYKYNGKELQGDHGLDWYDYGARFYDAQIGSFHTVDPHAENYVDYTVYNYVGGNPIKRIDPNGMDWYQYTDSTGATHTSWFNSQDKAYKYNGVEYSNIGTSYSMELQGGAYHNFYQNRFVGTSARELSDAEISEGVAANKSLYGSLIKRGSGLPEYGKRGLMRASAAYAKRNFAKDAWANPGTQGLLLFFGAAEIYQGARGMLCLHELKMLRQEASILAAANPQRWGSYYASVDALWSSQVTGMTNLARIAYNDYDFILTASGTAKVASDMLRRLVGKDPRFDPKAPKNSYEATQEVSAWWRRVPTLPVHLPQVP